MALAPASDATVKQIEEAIDRVHATHPAMHAATSVVLTKLIYQTENLWRGALSSARASNTPLAAAGDIHARDSRIRPNLWTGCPNAARNTPYRKRTLRPMLRLATFWD